MFRIHVLTVFLLVFPFISAEAQKDEIKTVAILGDSYSTFDGYIPEGNACWYFTTPQGENDVVAVEQTWWHQFCREGGYELVLNESYSGATVCNTGYPLLPWRSCCMCPQARCETATTRLWCSWSRC